MVPVVGVPSVPATGVEMVNVPVLLPCTTASLTRGEIVTDCVAPAQAAKFSAPVNGGVAISPGLVKPVIEYRTEPEVAPPVKAPVQVTVNVSVVALPSVTVAVVLVTL